MILLVDNYDSFSFNLVQVMGELVASREELKVIRNDELTVSEIMAVQHKTLPIYGVQFHPESIMTQQGKEMIRNFVTI